MKHTKKIVFGAALFALSGLANAACGDISYTTLQNAANNALASGQAGGLNLNMWATFVDETGKVCAVVNTGAKGSLAGNQQWLGSRVISAQKANTSNAFSLDALAISTGALYAAVQPGGSLFGLQESNPVDANSAYQGNSHNYGKTNDPLVGKRVGGVNVFGGGLPVYKNGAKIGAIGVSGDTSCTDHAFAWKMRDLMGLAGAPTTQVEKLHLTNTFVNLGDHPACIGATPDTSLGFQ
jgi:uncharacterized protein GlcG (DUF336 family)